MERRADLTAGRQIQTIGRLANPLCHFVRAKILEGKGLETADWRLMRIEHMAATLTVPARPLGTDAQCGFNQHCFHAIPGLGQLLLQS